jgi:hypothetical protein
MCSKGILEEIDILKLINCCSSVVPNTEFADPAKMDILFEFISQNSDTFLFSVSSKVLSTLDKLLSIVPQKHLQKWKVNKIIFLMLIYKELQQTWKPSPLVSHEEPNIKKKLFGWLKL